MRAITPAWAILASICAALLTGCGQDPTDADTGKLRVAVSITPQAWLVERIAGDHAEALTLVQPGQSPATYQPSDAQVSRVMRCDLYLRIGVPFERGRWFEALRSSDRLRVVDQRRGIELHDMQAHSHHHDAPPHTAENDHHEEEPGESTSEQHKAPEHEEAHESDAHASGKDPHIWLNPRLLKTQARTVADALTEADPAHESAYRSNLAQLEGELDELDREIRDTLAPLKGRTVLVFHPAWGYFLHAYGLKQVAVEVEGKQPSDRELTELQTLARRENVRIVFVQPQIPGKTAEAVAGTIGGRVETLDPLAPDVMANLRHAADRIKAALTPSGSDGEP